MNKYDEIMERLTVSEKAKDKLIAAVVKDGADNDIIVRSSTVKRIAAAAACLVILASAVLVIKNMRDDPIEPTTGGYNEYPIDYVTQNGVDEYTNAAELSEASGIAIEDLDYLPFEPTETVYRHFGDGFAEIVYSNGEKSLSYKVFCKGEDDPDSDEEYSSVYQKEIGGKVLTLKGDGDRIFCVLYRRGELNCSVVSTVGLTEKEIGMMNLR